jgi:ferric-dicitrate binding protein FerR (iron transport regulator)
MSQSSAMPQPSGRRRRMAPLILAIALAALIWLVIAVGGAVLSAWLS